MNIVIDGYNLLKQLLKRPTITDRERAQFHALAQAYSVRKNHSLVIVYDGGSAGKPVTEKKGNVTIAYSGWNMSADDLIKAYIDEKLLNDLLIVTTDRQINRHAARAGIPSIDSLDFYKIMKERKLPEHLVGFKKVSGEAQKLHEEDENAELDMLMQEGAQMLQYKGEDRQDKQKRGSPQQSSKQEKLQEQILKKL